MFTVGLKADPTPLVNYVYQVCYDRMIKMWLTGKHDSDIEDKLKREGKSINNFEVYEILYKESGIELPGTALHNQHINFYSGSDTSPVQIPSKQFVFRSPKQTTAFTIPGLKREHFQREFPDSVILSTQTDDVVANALLNSVRRISKLQPIGHLVMFDIKCEDIEDTDVFNMSKKAQSIHLMNCVFPDLTLDHLLQQIASSLTLTRIYIRGISLQGIKSLWIQYLPSLTYLCLCNTKLCRFHILHLGYLMENEKLPQLDSLNLGGNNFNHLQDDLNVFLQVVAKHHRRNIKVGINDCCLPLDFFQRIKEYTKSPYFLKIVGAIGREESEKVPDNIYKNMLNIWKQGNSLQRVSLRDCHLPRYLCAPILQALSSHGNLTNLDLSGNSLGIYGFHLVNTIESWTLAVTLKELDLSHCSLPVEVCGPLLSVLGRCQKLTELWLPGNTLTGCLGNFFAPPDLTLPHLEELFLSYTKLNAQDLLHLARLIQTEKMPKLKELDLGANELHRMENSFDDLLRTLVCHHQRVLKLNIYFNRLSQESVQRMNFLCEDTDIVLETEKQK